MGDAVCKMFEKLTSLMMERDLESMLEMFDDDAVLTDPHYPIERMEGKEAIRRGLTWGLETIAKPGFKIRRVFEHDNAGVAEVDTHHVLKVGMEVEFDQLFLFEAREGKFTSLRAFVPYRDPGIGGWITRVTGAWWRLRGYG